MTVSQFWLKYKRIAQVSAGEQRQLLGVTHPSDPQQLAEQLDKMAQGWRPMRVDPGIMEKFAALGVTVA